MQVARLSAVTRGDARTFVLRPGHATTLGRSSRCTVPLRDRKVSRVHCQLTFDQGHVVAADLDSRHGLQHLGQRKTILAMKVDDGFHIGETFVRFVAIDEVDDATVAAWFAPGGKYAPRPTVDAEAEAEADDAADEGEEPEPRADVPAEVVAEPSHRAQPDVPVGDAGFAPADPAPAAASAAGPVSTSPPGFALDDYPDLGQEVPRPQALARRRPPSAGKALGARLAAESIVFSIHMVLCVVALLVLRAAFGFDIYRAFGFAGP